VAISARMGKGAIGRCALAELAKRLAWSMQMLRAGASKHLIVQADGAETWRRN
jgi:hypothetical protein